jgi:hypothetical protein
VPVPGGFDLARQPRQVPGVGSDYEGLGFLAGQEADKVLVEENGNVQGQLSIFHLVKNGELAPLPLLMFLSSLDSDRRGGN